MDSLRQSVTLELFVYGSSEEPLAINIINQEVPVIRAISVSVIYNVLTYLVYKLQLRRECLYLYCKSSSLAYFEPLITFRGEGLFSDCNYQSILVLYSEVDVTATPDLQKYVESLFLSVFKLDIPMVEPQEISQKHSTFLSPSPVAFEKQLSHSRSLLSQRLISRQISSLRQTVTFTDNIAIDAKEMSSDHQPIYCRSPATLPFSYLRNKLRPKDVLVSPCYFSREYYILHCNRQIEVLPDDVHRDFYELNKNNELQLVNKEAIRNARGVFPEILKHAAYLLFTGQGIFKLQLPLRLFDTKSQLQAVVEFFRNVEYLKRASLTTNNLEIFKNVISFAVSGFIYKLILRKAFNPLMGETFQGKFADGTKVYVEHIGHEPPVDAILIVNEALGFRVHTKFVFEPKMSGMEFKIQFVGVVHVEIHGEKMSYTMPVIVSKANMSGERRLAIEGTMYFHYPKKNWKAYVHFGSPGPINTLKGLICVNDNVLDENQSALGSNLFSNIHKISQPKDQILSVISGCWIKSFAFDGVEYWNRSMPSYHLHMSLEVLPSDCRFREDLNWFIRGNLEYALAWKIRLEEVQREAQKSRTQNSKRKIG